MTKGMLDGKLLGEAMIRTKISYDASKAPLSLVNDVVVALLSHCKLDELLSHHISYYYDVDS
jgi:hypothetical protein